MKFKVGDTIRGKKGNGYTSTNELWEGVVIHVDPSGRMKTKTTKENKCNPGHIFAVDNDSRKFELIGTDDTSTGGGQPTKVGDRVRLVANHYDDSRSNPMWGGAFGHTYGTVDNIFGPIFHVEWDTGESNTYTPGDLELEVKKGKKKKAEAKKVDIDYKALDRLIIGDDMKKEIISVLEQHSNRETLFEKWGLGDVIEYGRGMTFLFHGGPGTGKTFAALLMSKAIGKEMLTLSSAEVQSSEPGAAQRSIKQAFAEAKSKDKVLFIDECDSLVTSRNELGMVLASEVNTLLTEIEKFEGVCILATNRISTLDEALERRLSLILEFPAPDFEARKRIWKNLMPTKLPLEAGVNIDILAEAKLTGGQIKNVVLNAARLALSDKLERIGVLHFEKASKRVLDGASLMGKHPRYHQHDGMGKGATFEKVNADTSSFITKEMAKIKTIETDHENA